MQWKKTGKSWAAGAKSPPCNWNPCGYSATLIFDHRTDSGELEGTQKGLWRANGL